MNKDKIHEQRTSLQHYFYTKKMETAWCVTRGMGKISIVQPSDKMPHSRACDATGKTGNERKRWP